MGRSEVTWSQALAWRLARQCLDPPGGLDTASPGYAFRPKTIGELVGRLAGVQAQVMSAAEQAIGVRMARARQSVVPALADGTLIRTWAMRGTLHLLTPADAGAYLSLLAAGRTWERPSWQKAFGATPAEMETFVATVGEVLDGRVLTREELIAEVIERTGSANMREGLASGWSTLLKPVAWQGMLCHGPPTGNGRVTFTRPGSWAPAWGGVPDPEEAAPRAIRAYLGAYGPASQDAFWGWLNRGIRRASLRAWFASMGDELTTVDVEGEPQYLLAEHLDELHATRPSKTVRLVPAFDQWILGPGTSAEYILPPQHRSEVSRTAGWISPLVLSGGRAVGVWEQAGEVVSVRLWEAVRRTALQAEVRRLRAVLGADPSTVEIAQSGSS